MMNKSLVKRVLASFFNRFSYDFSSVQCDLPDDISMNIKEWGRETIPDEDIHPEEGREENTHVTVKYGIHITDPTELRRIFYDQKPFSIVLGKTDIFKTDNYDVVILSVISSDLHRLNKIISDNFEVTDTHPEYRPHVTIAYVKKGLGKKYSGIDTFEGKKITLNSATFSGKDNRQTVIQFSR